MKAEQRKILFALFVILSLGLIHLYINTQNIALKFRVTENKIKVNELRSQNRLLGSQVARKEDLAQIEKIALSNLNMEFPAKVIYLAASKEALRP
jgi:hypothetical protein